MKLKPYKNHDLLSGGLWPTPSQGLPSELQNIDVQWPKSCPLRTARSHNQRDSDRKITGPSLFENEVRDILGKPLRSFMPDVTVQNPAEKTWDIFDSIQI